MATAIEVLSGSTDGRPIKITQTATAGDIIHTDDGTGVTKLWLWANNTDTTNRKLTLEWGGTTSPDDLIEVTIPAEAGAILIAAGMAIEDSVLVRAFAAAANVINITGYAEVIT